MPSREDIPIDSQSAIDEALRENLDIRYADDMTLQLDCDDEMAVQQFDRYEPRLRAHFDIKNVTRTVSRHGKTHIYVALNTPLPIPERIALQACLGSDPTREMLSLRRWLDHDSNPILLFEKKQALLKGDISVE